MLTLSEPWPPWLLHAVVTTVGPTHRATRARVANINNLVVAASNTKAPLL